MCGRYVSVSDRAALLRQFNATPVDAQPLPPDYNVAPSKPVYAVLERRRDHEPPIRELRVVHWGLIPSWAKDPSIGNRLVNARVETAAEKPSFRAAYARRRCVLPADGYYEWYAPQAAASLPTAGRSTQVKRVPKQPYYIHSASGEPLALAGLYEIWRDPSLPHEDPESLRWTCTILTTTATDELGRIHDRAPLLVSETEMASWLDPNLDIAPAGALVPAAPGLLAAYPVATMVNNVRHNGPELIAPLPADQAGS